MPLQSQLWAHWRCLRWRCLCPAALRPARQRAGVSPSSTVRPATSHVQAVQAEQHQAERVTASAGLLSFVLHLDKHLSEIIARHGAATYGILFAIVFAETGFVLTPFLPGWQPARCAALPRLSTPQLWHTAEAAVLVDAGDSLLFAAGAFAALGSLNLTYLLATFFVSVRRRQLKIVELSATTLRRDDHLLLVTGGPWRCGQLCCRQLCR